jgi:hypothetical protein
MLVKWAGYEGEDTYEPVSGLPAGMVQRYKLNCSSPLMKRQAESEGLIEKPPDAKPLAIVKCNKANWRTPSFVVEQLDGLVERYDHLKAGVIIQSGWPTVLIIGLSTFLIIKTIV